MTQTKKVKRQLYKNLLKTYLGWWQWHRICKKYRPDYSAVVIVPSESRDYNFYSLLYLDELLKRNGWSDAVFLSCNRAAINSAHIFSANIKKAAYLSRKQAQQILQYYCLYQFDTRLIVASLDEPSGRNAKSLIGVNGVTVEELMAIGVYKIYPFVKAIPPHYHGNDLEIKTFIESEVVCKK